MTIDEACRLVRDAALRKPHEVEFTRLGAGWAIRAYFEDEARDYRVSAEGAVEEVRYGFPRWPPSRALMKRGRCGDFVRRTRPEEE